MHYFILAAALLLGVMVWYRQAVGKAAPDRAGGREAAPAVGLSERTLCKKITPVIGSLEP